MTSWPIIIDGVEVGAASGGVYERRHPATGELVGVFPDGGAEDARRAVQAARRAFDDGRWRDTTGAERAGVLHRLADRLRDRGDAYRTWESRQVGIPAGQIGWLASYCADVVDFFAGAARTHAGRSLWTSPSTLGFTVPEPVGVVVAITPWNFPLVLTIWKVAAALAASCTLVVKPASQTPITVIELARDLLDCGLPPGVCNVVTGSGAVVGEALVTDPDVDKVAFTGSTATGARVMAAAARSITRVSLELGGKSPLIVLPDASPTVAVDAALECFVNAGQQCNVPSRLILVGDGHDVLDALVGRVGRLRVGADDDADVGPLVDEGHHGRVVGLLREAIDEGARVLVGGPKPAPFVAPTVLDGVDEDRRIVREEVFGPVLVVQRAKDLDHAIELANAGDYGLAAGIATGDLDAALVAARRLRAGTVWINTWNRTYPELPTGGFGASGLGRELGLEGLDAYLEPKTVQVEPARRAS
jgi:acyl-CoA reductase-like NAD-dependent aldehyde dehydrogenase